MKKKINLVVIIIIGVILTVPIIVITLVALLVLGSITLGIIAIWPRHVCRFGSILARIILYFLGVHLRFKGKLPKDKQFIVVANHTSFIDELLIGVVMGGKPWNIIFAKEITRIPFFGKIIRKFGIPVDRDNERSRKEAMFKLVKEAKDGKNIALFPEGKRLRPSDYKKRIVLYPFQIGAVLVAQKCNIPIYPVVFLFPFFYKPRSGRWWFSAPRLIKIVICEPVMVDGRDLNEVNQEIHDVMEKTIREYLLKKKKRKTLL